MPPPVARPRRCCCSPPTPAPRRARAGDPPNLCMHRADRSRTGEDVAPYCFHAHAGARPARDDTTRSQRTTATAAATTSSTYLRFDAAGEPARPRRDGRPGALSGRLHVRLRVRPGPAPNAARTPITMSVHRVLTPWTEDTVTWTNKPAYAEVAGGRRSPASPQPVDAGVRRHDLVRGWAHGTKPNHGFALTSPNDHTLGMYSWEAGGRRRRRRHALYIVIGPGTPPIPIMPAWITALLVDRCRDRARAAHAAEPRRSGSGKVEAVEIHHLVPRSHEVTHERLLRVVAAHRLPRWLGAESSNRRRGRRRCRST